ncbi:MAG: CesT family type III secretion system chaperone [Anaerolineae bacterium]|nr:CesT family type III secretion system chaperone [Anaerolineae bacterium]
MLPHLRSIEKGIKNIDGYLNRVSKGSKLDENGRCRLQADQVGIHIVVAPGQDLLTFKAYINLLPDPATGKVLPLYYHLLDMSDEPETGQAYFAIVASEEVGGEHDVISVECKRPIVDISFDEFTACLQAVSSVANQWMDRLEEEFDAPKVP